MPQLEIASYFSQLFWLAICFAIVLLFSWRISLPRLAVLLQQRWEQIEGQKKLAHTLRMEAEALQHAHDQTLEHAHHQAKEIVLHADRQVKLIFEQEKARISETMKKNITVTEARLLEKKEQISKEMPKILRELTHEIIKKTLKPSNFSRITQTNIKKEEITDV